MSEFQIVPFQSKYTNETLDIYGYYVRNTCITFDLEVPTEIEWGQKLSAICAKYPCFVCLIGETVVGFAYASQLRQKRAYDWSVESTIYVHTEYKQMGIGKVLYAELVNQLEKLNIVNVFACITLPNDSSIALHTSFGFQEVGSFQHVGYKHNEWHSVLWMQKVIPQNKENPQPINFFEL